MFNVKQLIKNQRQHIANFIDNPEYDKYTKNIFTEEFRPENVDSLIEAAFTDFPLEETKHLKLFTMDGPVAMIPDKFCPNMPVVSRPSKMTVPIVGTVPDVDFAKDYAIRLVGQIERTLIRIQANQTYIFGMFIPVYSFDATFRPGTACMMTHYSQKVV